MTDDLRGRLDALAQRAPDGAPDVASVVVAGRRHKRRRVVTATVSVAATMALLIVAGASLDLGDRRPLQPATHEDGVFEPAQPGEPTYILTDFEIRYPYAKVDGMPGFRPGSDRREQYCSEPTRKADCEAEGNAGFLYEWEWSTKRYPGMVRCRVILFSDDDEVVGRQMWELSGLEATSRRPTDILVHVPGRPTRAQAECEAGMIESGPTHRFTYLRAELFNTNPRPDARPDYRYRLFFDVETLTEHSTGMCRLTVQYESGKKLSESFTMTGAPRADHEVDLGAPYRRGDPVKNANVRCRTYKREFRD